MKAKESSDRRSDALTIIGLGRAIEVAVSDAGVTSTRYRALTLVQAGVTSSGVLAAFLAVRPPTVTTVMNGMVDDGLVDRIRATDDRRRVGYDLTAEGADVLARANAAADRVLCTLSAEMSPEERETAFAGVALWRGALDRRRSET
jgi:DNA-binding MarR family transcriptional regulator